MTDYEKDSRSLEERVAACPIHEWGDIQSYFDKVSDLPSNLWEPFQQFVLARGQFPKHMGKQHNQKFTAIAMQITRDYEITPKTLEQIQDKFSQLIIEWMTSESWQN